MKRSYISILSLILVFLLACPAEAQESVLRNRNKSKLLQSFDTSKNETTVYVTTGLSTLMILHLPDILGSEPRANLVKLTLLDAYYKFPGKAPTRPQNVSFTFISRETKAKYKDLTNFSVDLENKQAFQGDYQYKEAQVQTINRKLIQEILKVTIPTDIFLQVAQAKKVIFNFGSQNYEVRGNERKSLKELAESIQ